MKYLWFLLCVLCVACSSSNDAAPTPTNEFMIPGKYCAQPPCSCDTENFGWVWFTNDNEANVPLDVYSNVPGFSSPQRLIRNGVRMSVKVPAGVAYWVRFDYTDGQVACASRTFGPLSKCQGADGYPEVFGCHGS